MTKKQSFKKWLVLCLLLVTGSAGAVADDIESGSYYYIVNTYTGYILPNSNYYPYESGKQLAFHVFNHQLHWKVFDKTDAYQIFKLTKSEDTKDNDYYLESVADGSSFYGQTNYNVLEMRTEGTNNEKHTETMRFTKQTDGTYLIRPKLPRFDLKEATGTTNDSARNNLRITTSAAGTNQGKVLNVSANRENFRALNQSIITETGSYWKLIKVTDDERQIALSKNKLIKAYEVYNAQLAYGENSTGLITNTSATDAWGKGSQVLLSTSPDNSGYFARLIDGKYDKQVRVDNTLGAKYPDGNTVVRAPQFIQVDLGENVNSKGVKMAYGLETEDWGWGSSLQMHHVTLYATNDATAAAGDFKIDACAADNNWTKIGESLLDVSHSYQYASSVNNFGTTNRTSYYTWRNINNDKSQEIDPEYFGLKGKAYRYLRFYVNSVLFPYTDNMGFKIGELQFYNLDDVNVINSKKYLVEQLNETVSAAEVILKSKTEGFTEDETKKVTAISSAINAVEQNASVSISEIGYASFVSDENVKLADGLEAYIVTGKTTADGQSYATLKKVADAGQTLPANTPVLIKGAKGDYVLPISTEDAVSITDENLLKGKARAITTQDGSSTYYVLTAKSSTEPTVPVIKRLKSGTNVPAGYAYLTNSTGQSPAFFNLSLYEATGIQSAANAENNKAEKTYDLEGRSVKHPQKGIYIRGGKKVVIK